METRIALIGIVLNSTESVDELNHLLSEYGSFIIGRMGIPTGKRTCPSSASPWMPRQTPSARCPESWACFRASAPKQFTQKTNNLCSLA